MDQINTNEPKGGMGPLIGSIIIIIVLVIGAVYFWGDKLNKQEIKDDAPAALSASDDATTLEQDLQNTPDVSADINNL